MGQTNLVDTSVVVRSFYSSSVRNICIVSVSSHRTSVVDRFLYHILASAAIARWEKGDHSVASEVTAAPNSVAAGKSERSLDPVRVEIHCKKREAGLVFAIT